jgi:KaiC/GvpD/RAD55 family RecA-like ATPase
MEYVRVCNDLKDKGTLIPANGTDLSVIYKRINREKDNYASIYYFTEAHNEQFKKTGSVAGITDVTTDRLVWDFDSEDSVGIAQKDAVELVKRLKNEGYDDTNIRVFFSGNKGFDVSVQLKNERLTPREVKNVCINLAEGLKTIDVKIYNATRILRLPLTKHPKSGLYKIPLSVEDLQTFTSDEIRTAAKENLEYTDIKDAWGKGMLSKNILELKAKTPALDLSEVLAVTVEIKDIDWSKRPAELTPAKWLLELGHFGNGERSHAAMILASTYKNLGYDENKAYYNLKAAMHKQSLIQGGDKFPKEELWHNVIKQVYGPLWGGGTYSEKTDELLARLAAAVPEEQNPVLRKDILSIDEVGTIFSDFAANIDQNRLEFGIASLDKNLDAMVGRTYIIGGSPGCGKTSLVTQIANNTSLKNIQSIFFSFDMSLEDVYQKLIQKHYKISAKEVYEQMKDNDRRSEFRDTLIKNYGNVHFIRSSGMTIEAMRNRITEIEKKFGSIKLIMVDYLDLVQGDFSDPTQKSMAGIQGLKAIGSEMRKCMLILSQPNKANQKINEPVSTYAAIKGSSAVAELANAVLWLHRPGASARGFEDDKYMGVDCLKNRHGAMFALDFAWNGVAGTITEMTLPQKHALDNLRQKLKEEKAGASEDLF